MKNENLENVARCNFVSFLCDGSTDLSANEKELMKIIFLDPDTHEIQFMFFLPQKCYLSEGLMETFLETFQSKGVSDVIGKKIYFPSNGATVNSGLKNGLITKMGKKFWR